MKFKYYFRNGIYFQYGINYLMILQKPSSLTVVVGVLLLELGACEKLKYGGHNVDS